MRMLIKSESYCYKGKIISLYGQLLCELSGEMIIKLFGNCTVRNTAWMAQRCNSSNGSTINRSDRGNPKSICYNNGRKKEHKAERGGIQIQIL